MKTDYQSIHDKLDQLVAELRAIRKGLDNLHTHSPPLSLSEAASYLHISKSRVYYLVNTGQLKPLQRRKGGRLLFSHEFLNTYLYGKQK